MLITPLCDLLGIKVPIIQAGMTVFTSAELVAAVSNAGGLGTLGAWRRPNNDLVRQLGLIRELTDKPFAVNHVVPEISEDNLQLTLQAKPAVISFALDDPGEYVKRAHDVGSLVVHQVTTVQQAYQAAERGVDVIIARGGYVSPIATLIFVPQVVDAVSPTLVVAAGGITDGRSLAAVLMLGAVGANVGTRFLASKEAPISADWKNMIVEARSEDAVKVEVRSPLPENTGYGTAEQQGRQLQSASQEGSLNDLLPGTGESSGLIHDVLPAGEIVRNMATTAERVMEQAGEFLK